MQKEDAEENVESIYHPYGQGNKVKMLGLAKNLELWIESSLGLDL